jgi:hypothetical protein
MVDDLRFALHGSGVSGEESLEGHLRAERTRKVRTDKHADPGQVFGLGLNYCRTFLQLHIQPDGQACSNPRSHTEESRLRLLN